MNRTTETSPGQLREFVPGRVWLIEYGLRYGGMSLTARTTLVRLADGGLWVHSPCPLSPGLRRQLSALGPVAHVVAPGNFHHLHLAAWAEAYPEAARWLCPGLRDKRPNLPAGTELSDVPPAAWRDELDQVVVRGNRVIREVLFFHRPSRTLIVTDSIEFYGDQTEHVPLLLKLWWRLFRKWNRPALAPEYDVGWRDRGAAGASLSQALQWDFERIALSHGDLIEHDAHAQAERAWQSLVGKHA